MKLPAFSVIKDCARYEAIVCCSQTILTHSINQSARALSTPYASLADMPRPDEQLSTTRALEPRGFARQCRKIADDRTADVRRAAPDAVSRYLGWRSAFLSTRP